MLKTAPVRLGCNVTIGVGSVIEIDVVAGDGCQVGAMSLVPKHTRLDAGAPYIGIPGAEVCRAGVTVTLRYGPKRHDDQAS